MQTAPTPASSPAPSSGSSDVARLLGHDGGGARKLTAPRDAGSAVLLELDAGDDTDAGQGVRDGGALPSPVIADAGVADAGAHDAGRSCKLTAPPGASGYLCAGVCQPWPCL